MNIKQTTGPTICRICKRKKRKAILEQKYKAEPCDDSPEFICGFKAEILKAIKKKSFTIVRTKHNEN